MLSAASHPSDSIDLIKPKGRLFKQDITWPWGCMLIWPCPKQTKRWRFLDVYSVSYEWKTFFWNGTSFTV